jgi:hypothetical protein
MNYYLALKEEKIIKLMMISTNAKEILLRLDEIEKEVGIENILPFYDELIEMVRMSIEIKSEDLKKYYDLYKNTFMFSNMRLSQTLRCLGQSFTDSLNLVKMAEYIQHYSQNIFKPNRFSRRKKM